jgi:Flp pilus assembly protein TadG
MNTKTSSRARRQVEGQALVEFALVVPLLALLLFAIIQYGFIFNAYIGVRHAAHVTARTMALTGTSTNSANVLAIAQGQLQQVYLDPTKLTSATLQSVTIANANDAYKVSLYYSMPLYMRFVVPGANSGTIAINASAVYRRL